MGKNTPYTYRHPGYVLLPYDILRVLGEILPSHPDIRILAWASTPVQAQERLDDLGIGSSTTENPLVPAALVSRCSSVISGAHEWPEGTVLAARASMTGLVFQIREHPSRDALVVQAAGEIHRDPALRESAASEFTFLAKPAREPDAVYAPGVAAALEIASDLNDHHDFDPIIADAVRAAIDAVAPQIRLTEARAAHGRTG